MDSRLEFLLYCLLIGSSTSCFKVGGRGCAFCRWILCSGPSLLSLKLDSSQLFKTTLSHLQTIWEFLLFPFSLLLLCFDNFLTLLTSAKINYKRRRETSSQFLLHCLYRFVWKETKIQTKLEFEDFIQLNLSILSLGLICTDNRGVGRTSEKYLEEIKHFLKLNSLKWQIFHSHGKAIAQRSKWTEVLRKRILCLIYL